MSRHVPKRRREGKKTYFYVSFDNRYKVGEKKTCVMPFFTVFRKPRFCQAIEHARKLWKESDGKADLSIIGVKKGVIVKVIPYEPLDEDVIELVERDFEESIKGPKGGELTRDMLESARQKISAAVRVPQVFLYSALDAKMTSKMLAAQARFETGEFATLTYKKKG